MSVGEARAALASGVHYMSAGGTTMLLAIATVLAIAWLLGFTVFHVASGALHVLIVIALIVAVVHFVQGRRAPL
ncbi:MAG TPA: lmo0937 family membrane protein [Kofleriaceae bacterium]|nr:lmo0937 family membrane protein [Kofleriaceae bacterium]